MIVSPQQARRGWNDWYILGGALMVALGIAVTLDAWRDIGLTSIYRHHVRHLFLMPGVVGWLIWVRRERIKLCEPAGTWIGPVMVLGGWFASGLGYRTDVAVVWHVGAMAVVIGCLVSVLGRRVFSAFSPAFGALLFAIPIPGRVLDYMTYRLSEIASTLVQPVLGSSVTIMQMQEAASGLLCAVLLAYAFAFGTPYRGWVRGLLITLSPLATVLVLMFQMGLYRFFMTLHHADQAWAATWTAQAGWLMIPLILVMLWGLIRLLRWAAVPLQYYKLAETA